MKQIIFLALVLITIAVFIHSVFRLYSYFKLTRKACPIKQIGKRIWMTLEYAIFQKSIFRNPIAGFMHALVFWGFLVILAGSLEMIIDGLAGTEHSLSFLGIFYKILMAAGDLSAYFIALFIVIFIIRRCCLNIQRLHGKELKKKNHQDAYLALALILVLMVTLIGLNIFLVSTQPVVPGKYPISELLAPLFMSLSVPARHFLYEFNWWAHIVLIFIFANILPYSKHFHIFMSIPNVFLGRLDVLGKIHNMECVTREVKIMLNPETAYAAGTDQPVERFGVLDAEDVNWKNYLDSLTCTQCGRCSSVCPANLTGKELSPRKLFIDLRARMKEKGKHLIKDKDYSDGKALVGDYISLPEIWACTTCNACAKECPLSINHPSFIIDMRRYLVMEKGTAPAELNAIFANIENNGAPWQYSKDDRLEWTK